MAESYLDMIFRTKKEGAAGKQVADELKQVKSGLTGAIEGMTGMSLASLGVAGVLTAVGTTMRASVVETVAYAEQVRDLGRISGASAEETSRLIQTADDLKIEYGTLQQAAKALAKEGIALTTEELAKSSDEYLAITDAGGRAEYATNKFGKAGIELTKILETGGAALRDMAKNQSSSMLLTEAQVVAARKLEIAQDDLEDSIQGVKYALGNDLIPTVTVAIKALTDYVFWTDKTRQKMLDASKSYPEYLSQIKDEIRARNENQRIMRGILGGVAPGMLAYMDAETMKGLILSEVQYKLKTGYYNIADEGTRAVDAQKRFAANTAEARSAIEELNPELANLRLALQNEEGAYIDTGSAAVDYNAKLQLTEDAVGRLVSKYGDLTTAQIYNTLAVGLDRDAAIALGVAMGILNPVIIAGKDAVDALDARFQGAARNTAAFTGQAEALGAAIAKLKDKSIAIDTYYNYYGQRSDNLTVDPRGAGGPGGAPAPEWQPSPGSRNLAPDREEKVTQLADGGDFIVPPGFMNDSYPLRVQSGERVIVIPRDQVNGNKKSGAVNNFYTTINNEMDQETFKRMLVEALS